MIFRFFFEFSSCQLQAGRANSRVAHSSLSLHKFDELNEIRNRIHAEQRQEPAIQPTVRLFELNSKPSVDRAATPSSAVTGKSTDSNSTHHIRLPLQSAKWLGWD
jgi:hypothetical protein